MSAGPFSAGDMKEVDLVLKATDMRNRAQACGRQLRHPPAHHNRHPSIRRMGEKARPRNKVI
jgi:hypothetical protein